MMMAGRNSGRCPFTASQWQELETQALIFKYMASGHPIPPDLILPIRKSILMDTSPPTLFPHQPNTIGWGYFQMGFGRKAEDPEPGRCRRTDGKKWRCAKEAYPDSKYCERHMHRGKNRSRKPVEMSLNTTPTITKSHNYNSSSSSSYLNMAASETHSSMYPYNSYSKPPVIGLSPQSNTTQYHLDSMSSSGERDYRYLNQSQYSCFSDGSEAERSDSWRFTPLGMSLGEPKQNSCSQFGGEEQEKQQHCFVLGSDFKLGRNERDFFQEWPLKNKETWMALEEDSSFTRTQLSISMAHHDLSKSQSRTDD